MMWEIVKTLGVFWVFVIGMVCAVPVIGLLEYFGIIKKDDIGDFEEDDD